MEESNRKSKVIVLLFSAVIALIVLNVTAEIFIKSEDPPPPREFSSDTLNVIFWDALKIYGIPSEWVTAKRVGINDYDSIRQILRVDLPQSIAPIDILKEISSRLPEEFANVVSFEKQINGNSEILIYSNSYLKLKAELRINKNIRVDQPTLAFLLDDMDEINGDEFENLLLNPYKFGLLLKPSAENRGLLGRIKENLKEYFVLIDNDVDQESYDLNVDMDKKELSGAVKNICGHFADAEEILIDQDSELFNSALFNFIRDEFKKFGRILIPLRTFDRIEKKEDQDLKSVFKYYIESLDKEDRKSFVISAVQFKELGDELSKIKKKGYVIEYPSRLISE